MVALGKADDRENAQMRAAQPRLETAGQRLVGEQRVEIHRHFGHANAVALGRDVRNAGRSAVSASSSQRHSGMKPSRSCRTRSVLIDESRQDSRASAPASRPGLRRRSFRRERLLRRAAGRGSVRK